MTQKGGTIALMGSGELTATMVEVHKSLLRPYGKSATAAFVDTPAGFQLNVDHIYQKAAEYFDQRIGHPLHLATFKSMEENDYASVEQACAALRRADYVLIGPGSPTYALRQWQQSPIPNLMIDLIARGGCLVAASAAALTVGSATLPVYEIYKVGQPPHWVDGLDLLGHFGLDLVVIPHWNNAEGGNHDTRYCFMGASRLEQLEAMLPSGATILGLDEHTALIIDLEKPDAVIRGVGQVILRRQGRESVFHKGDAVPLAMLRGELGPEQHEAGNTHLLKADMAEEKQVDVWDTIHALADKIRDALELRRDEKVGGLILELERIIWKNQRHLDETNEMGAAREVVREFVSLLAAEVSTRPADRRECLSSLVEAMIDLREDLRSQKSWAAADAVREGLERAAIILSDTPDGTKWTLVD